MTTYDSPRSATVALTSGPSGGFAGRSPASTVSTALDSGHEPEIATRGAEPAAFCADARDGASSRRTPLVQTNKSRGALMGSGTKDCYHVESFALYPTDLLRAMGLSQTLHERTSTTLPFGHVSKYCRSSLPVSVCTLGSSDQRSGE